MTKHTTFKCGGSADFFIEIETIDDLIKLKKASLKYNFPLFILGGGANLLVSDRGIRGITISLKNLDAVELHDKTIIVEAGISVNRVAEFALSKSLSGLEFIYGMPGSIGGATWMNARCYDKSISDIFLWADIITSAGKIVRINKTDSDWAYKISPFQKDGIVITKVAFILESELPSVIQKKMKLNREDRRIKGHFRYPCAGSVFKNNRSFGAPSGKIIEDAGLKGLVKGKAKIADFHGNIIVNLGGATSSDINYLIQKIITTVKNQTGNKLELEILKIGDWG